MRIVKIQFNRIDSLVFLSFLIISVAIFGYFLIQNYPVNYYDQNGYINISKSISNDGLFNIQDPVFKFRTYFYPLIISILNFISMDNLIVSKILMSIFQYSVYLTAIIFSANSIASRQNNKLIWYSIISFGFINPYLISISTLFLADSLSISFIAITILGLIRFDLSKTKLIALVMGLFYISIMLRPSSVVFLPILIGIILFRIVKYKSINISKFLVLSFCLLIIFVPQLYNNINQFEHWTPLTHRDLYSMTTISGVETLKYTTIIIPDQEPALRWHSPYPFVERQSIFDVLVVNPPQFIYIYFSHLFSVLDWGYLDVYVKDLHPINRIPASFFIYTTWFFVLVGIIHYFSQKLTSESTHFILKSLLISAILYGAFLGTTHAESRYGYPIYILLLPFTGYGIKWIYDSSIRKKSKDEKLWLKRIRFSVLYLTFVSLFFYASFSFDLLTEQIDWFTKIVELF